MDYGGCHDMIVLSISCCVGVRVARGSLLSVIVLLCYFFTRVGLLVCDMDTASTKHVMQLYCLVV